MSDPTLDNIKTGKGLEPLQSGNTSKSGVTNEHRSGGRVKTTQYNPGITHEKFTYHPDNNNTDKNK